jgi:hypothetical protein
VRAGLTALLLLAGCVTTPRPPPPPPALVLKLSPASLGRELALSQRITVVREGERRSFDAQLEVDASAVRIAAVAMGQTFATLTWDGEKLDQRVSERVPEVVTAERILSDVQLAWWPLEAVRAGLPPGYRLEAQGPERTLFDGETKLATISYEGTGPAWPRVQLTHHRHGYRLEIESVESGP